MLQSPASTDLAVSQASAKVRYEQLWILNAFWVGFLQMIVKSHVIWIMS